MGRALAARAANGAPLALSEIHLGRIAGGKVAERGYTVDRSTLPR
jgi:hypothetical protein